MTTSRVTLAIYVAVRSMNQRVVMMTEQEAKEIIKNEPYTNVRKHLEAIQVAVKALGEDCTMADIWKWAESK